MHDPAESRQSRPHRAARLFNYLHRFRKVLQRRWWMLPLTMAIGLGIQGWRVFRQPPAYLSTGKMIVSMRVQTKMGTSYSEVPIDFLGTQRKLMMSSIVHQRASERVRALKPRLTPGAIHQVQIAISPKTTIFEWQIVGSDPEYTTAYLDAAMDEFVQLKKDMRSDTSRVTLQSLDDQIRKSVDELKGYEAEMLNFQASNSVVFLQEQGKGADSFLAQLSTRLAGLRIDYELLDLLTLDQNIERQQKDYATGSGNNPSTPDNLLHSDYLRARQEIQLKKNELKEWSEVRKPKHPLMVALSEDIARREKLLEFYKEQSKEQLSSRRDRIGLEITNLVREVRELETKSLDISKKMADYERIRSGKQRAQQLYEKLLESMQALSVDKDINPESINVLERARPAIEAHSNTARALIIGGVLGLLAGIGLLLVVDRFDDRPVSFTDLTDMFDEPVLGQIPLEKPGDRRKGIPVIQEGDNRHALVEAYRNQRSSLLYMATEGKRPKTIVVTSAIPGDGKSMTTSNLAVTLAMAGARVLLVDADLRRGQLHSKFNIASATPGLTEVLSGFPWAQAVQPTATPNLSLLPRGNIARNPGELFLNQRTRDLLKELAVQFDYVIIDTAPVMAADDVTSLSPHVDGVIFVVRASYTSGRVARAALDLLYQREVDVLGLVFNGVETNASEYYYYKYKDYYAEYKSA